MFGDKLKKIRIEQGFKQTELAKLINVHPNTISRWERNAGTPKTGDIVVIAAAMGVPVSRLMGDQINVVQERHDFNLLPYSQLYDRARREGRLMSYDDKSLVMQMIEKAIDELTLHKGLKYYPATKYFYEEKEIVEVELFDHRKEYQGSDAFNFELSPYVAIYDLAVKDADIANEAQRDYAINMLTRTMHEIYADFIKDHPEVWEMIAKAQNGVRDLKRD